MSSTITLSRQVYNLLVQQAQQANQTPDTLAEDLLRRSLTTETQQWRESFDALIRRVQARTSQFSSEEIEADITVAAEEVKELRRARCRRD
jgi:hypothetical protein